MYELISYNIYLITYKQDVCSLYISESDDLRYPLLGVLGIYTTGKEDILSRKAEFYCLVLCPNICI